jgi:TolA-binding protein
VVGHAAPSASAIALLRVLILLIGFCAITASAQTPETRAYDAAENAFRDRIPELADKYFREFIQAYPNSPRVPEAILYRARAALLRRDIAAATALLTTNAARATQLQDQYRYWLAETHREATNYTAAADTFASLVRDFPASPRVLEASYGEAVARFKLQQWSRVIDLLRATNAPFAKEAQARPNHELVLRGQFLLADALLENGDASAAEAALRSLSQRELAAEFRWRSEYLLCRIRLVQGRADDALAAGTNLVALAAATGQRQFIAESHAVHGAVLERLADYDAAIAAYQRNMTETSPPEYRRQALLRIIQLTLEQNKLNEATEKLESFFIQYPNDDASEVALLTLGELNVRRHLAGLSNRTNTARSPPISCKSPSLTSIAWSPTIRPAPLSAKLILIVAGASGSMAECLKHNRPSNSPRANCPIPKARPSLVQARRRPIPTPRLHQRPRRVSRGHQRLQNPSARAG